MAGPLYSDNSPELMSWKGDPPLARVHTPIEVSTTEDIHCLRGYVQLICTPVRAGKRQMCQVYLRLEQVHDSTHFRQQQAIVRDVRAPADARVVTVDMIRDHELAGAAEADEMVVEPVGAPYHDGDSSDNTNSIVSFNRRIRARWGSAHVHQHHPELQDVWLALCDETP